MACHCIVYVSEATADLSEAALLTLLRQARAEHQQARLTGLLLYSGGRFLQVLEGAEASLREFFGRIAADPRHGKLQKLADGPKSQPDFAEWHMSFASSAAGHYHQQPGYLALPQLVAAAEATSVRQLLHEFLAEGQVPRP